MKKVMSMKSRKKPDPWLMQLEKAFVAEMESLGGFYHVPAGPYVVSVNDATTDPVEVDLYIDDGTSRAWTMKVPRRRWDRKSILEYIAAWKPPVPTLGRVESSKVVSISDYRARKNLEAQIDD